MIFIEKKVQYFETCQQIYGNIFYNLFIFFNYKLYENKIRKDTSINISFKNFYLSKIFYSKEYKYINKNI